MAALVSKAARQPLPLARAPSSVHGTGGTYLYTYTADTYAELARHFGIWTVPRATGPNDFGHCFVVLDPARLGGGMGGGLGFEDRLAAYLATMRALPGSVQVPGDPEKAHEAEAAAHGVTLHPNVAAAVKALALRWSVALPKSFDGIDATMLDGAAEHVRPEGRTAHTESRP